ncbi:hypothetical protein L1887_51955 [Cichorium endivia]|nr:hypothetical protein L1887_51955 [Cichorium endivia]
MRPAACGALQGSRCELALEHVSEHVERALFERVAKDDEVPLCARIVGEQEDLGAPVLDVTLALVEAEEVLADKVVGDVASVAPGFGWREEVDHDKEEDGKDDAYGGDGGVGEEHGAKAADGTARGGPDVPVLEGRTEAGRTACLERAGCEAERAKSEEGGHGDELSDGVDRVDKEDGLAKDVGDEDGVDGRVADLGALGKDVEDGEQIVACDGLEDLAACHGAHEGGEGGGGEGAKGDDLRAERDVRDDADVDVEGLAVDGACKDDEAEEVDEEGEKERVICALWDALAGFAQVARHGGACEDAGDGGEEDAEDGLPVFGLGAGGGPCGACGEVREEVASERLPRPTGVVGAAVVVDEGLYGEGGDGKADDGDRQDEGEGESGACKELGADEAYDGAEEEDDGAIEEVVPGTLGEKAGIASALAEGVCERLYETEHVHGGVEGLACEEDEADGAAELGAEGAGDEIVCASAADLSVGADGVEAHGGERVDGIAEEQEEEGAEQAGLADDESEAEEEDDAEDVEADGHEHAVPGAELARSHLCGADHAEALCAREVGGVVNRILEAAIGVCRATVSLSVSSRVAILAWADVAIGEGDAFGHPARPYGGGAVCEKGGRGGR